MIVYVESNFLVEIARQQEQATSAEALLGLAEGGGLTMRWPAFCLAESLGALMRLGNARKAVQSEIVRQAKDLGRSDAHASLAGKLREVSGDLAAVDALESARLDSVVRRLMVLGSPVPLEPRIYDGALDYRTKYGLSTQDAVVYASVIADLGRQDRSGRKLFVSRNSNDFETEDLTAELAALGCAYVASFDMALRAARAD